MPAAQTYGSALPLCCRKYCAEPEPIVTPAKPAANTIIPKMVVALIMGVYRIEMERELVLEHAGAGIIEKDMDTHFDL